MSETEYRIDFTITKRDPEDEDFIEVGVGASGTWKTLDECALEVSALIQNNEWEEL